jgi:hypothetical protein
VQAAPGMDWPMAVITASKRVFSAMFGLILDSLIG